MLAGICGTEELPDALHVMIVISTCHMRPDTKLAMGNSLKGKCSLELPAA